MATAKQRSLTCWDYRKKSFEKIKNNRLIIWIIRKRLLSLHCQLETMSNIKSKQYGNTRRVVEVLQRTEGDAQEDSGI